MTENSVVAVWYKYANAQDHANFTTVTGHLSNSDSWSTGLDTFTGFNGPATLDLSGSYSSGGTTLDASVPMAGSQVATEEIAIYVNASTGSFAGPITEDYTPDGGTTTYAGSSLTNGASASAKYWAHPTTKGSSCSAVFQFTTTARTVQAVAATFYDPSTLATGNMLTVMGA